jgi:transposase
MQKTTRWIGLDVHAETIAIAVAEKDGTVHSVGTIPNRPEAVRRAIKKLEKGGKLHVAYEAGPCGYGLYWQLTEMGIECDVVAPTLIPVKAGDKVKTDRRDAEKLARLLRSGDLTAVWVPDAEQQALRDLVRARHAAKRDQLRHRNRLGKFLLQLDVRRPEKIVAWGTKHMVWLDGLTLPHASHQEVLVDYLNEVKRAKERIERLEKAIDAGIARAPKHLQELISALQVLRGVAKIGAATLVTEVGRFSRFESAGKLMAYVGVVPSEHSSGGSTHRGSISKTGNARMRHVVGEAAWSYRHRPSIGPAMKKRQEGQDEDVKAIAWKAQHRLHKRFQKLSAAGKHHGRVITAISRELLGFVWAIGCKVEAELDAAA